MQQKQRLLDQQRLQFSNTGTLKSNDINSINQNASSQPYYKQEESKDINYENLAKYAYEGKKEFYDPSFKKNVIY